MKKNIITILFLSIIGAQGINSNINSFNTNVVLRPTEGNIEVIAFVVEVPISEKMGRNGVTNVTDFDGVVEFLKEVFISSR